ncbi:hypothetical protein MAPG_00461 [Magnaporthiopsis poae ATCC 64411]|uniref:Uncharacterized protein n=1 Tax=Magnaporthiopsis poae (strain ATCC 64411 / 73-15) TaxID=644358 RepID=A0A0C4DL26_MAGP6|nr:hypothetical protein MAPG_00461 [Magnaporthiopsis poae ATCC 64411]
MRLMQVAVLDDYQGISEPHFATLDKSIFEVTTFKNTLLPYNHPDTPASVKDELVTRLEPFTVICTMRERTPFPADLIARLPNLKLLLTTGPRNRSIDLAACRERGIPVAGAMGKVHGGPADDGGPRLDDSALAAAEAGLPVEDEEGQKTFRVVSREELFATADVLSVHLVLSDRTRGLVGAGDLARMKETALLVNTSRGPIVQERALLNVLEKGAIRGAALDVFDLEPLPLDSPWRTTEWGKDGRSQVLLTPHMGYVEKQTLDNWYEVQVENVQRWQKGQELLLPF